MSEKEKFDVNKYQSQYKKEHYSRICFRVPKEKRLDERVRAIAKEQGMSSTQFIINAIEKELAWYE